MQELIGSYAKTLKVDREIVAPGRVLAAICVVETNGWKNRQPNFENAYYVGGRYYSAKAFIQATNKSDPVLRLAMGALMACSFGPFQIMYTTACELGFEGSPMELHDPKTNLLMAIRYINKRVLAKMDEKTERDTVIRIADGYNTGSPRDRIRNYDYEYKVWAAYKDDDLYDKLVVLPNYSL